MNPFATGDADRVDTLSESLVIEQLREWLGNATRSSPAGMGDDCAVLDLPANHSRLLVTADPVVYQRHFDDQLTPEDVAQKLLKRNLSDIASMGGTPHSAVVSLALPSNLSLKWLQQFYRSLSRASLRYGMTIAGGDLTSTDSFLGAFMTLIGLPSQKVLERCAAPLGAALYVTGSLGGASLGKHYSFEPRLEEGQWLARQSETISCMDLSDGLGKDCRAFLQSGFALRLEANQLPISEAAHQLSRHSGQTPLYHAVNDGEDYELLFALDPSTDHAAFESRWTRSLTTPLSRIGLIVKRESEDPIVSFSDPKLNVSFSGYEHFRST